MLLKSSLVKGSLETERSASTLMSGYNVAGDLSALSGTRCSARRVVCRCRLFDNKHVLVAAISVTVIVPGVMRFELSVDHHGR